MIPNTPSLHGSLEVSATRTRRGRMYRLNLSPVLCQNFQYRRPWNGKQNSGVSSMIPPRYPSRRNVFLVTAPLTLWSVVLVILPQWPTLCHGQGSPTIVGPSTLGYHQGLSLVGSISKKGLRDKGSVAQLELERGFSSSWYSEAPTKVPSRWVGTDDQF